MIDINLFFAEEVDERIDDLYRLYKTTSQTDAIGILTKYHINYFYISARAQQEYGLFKPTYIDTSCFTTVFSNIAATVYEVKCTLPGEAT